MFAQQRGRGSARVHGCGGGSTPDGWLLESPVLNKVHAVEEHGSRPDHSARAQGYCRLPDCSKQLEPVATVARALHLHPQVPRHPSSPAESRNAPGLVQRRRCRTSAPVPPCAFLLPSSASPQAPNLENHMMPLHFFHGHLCIASRISPISRVCTATALRMRGALRFYASFFQPTADARREMQSLHHARARRMHHNTNWPETTTPPPDLIQFMTRQLDYSQPRPAA